MDRIEKAATNRSPLVDFDFPNGTLLLRGESYPEDAAAFFGPLLQALRAFLEADELEPVTLTVELAYFNSSSAKALMNLFMALEDAAADGRPVTVRWLYAEGDESIEEAGEDFAADFEHAHFELVKLEQSHG
ncbi:DUF1987 domain-containing protein [Methylobacterium organophilum]|uniref:SiaC family regulatory phosphoprotein domain-containing protein n=1 Tax=Methylobacterium organophilum TaxID=410 RepID=A0ABQ4TGW5_METOR|nr:DUF1987 domain-containing protein [Methylobacterium organophilum]UMY17493.1 DUF1987 domain-containing protein [Methylobacterium organophilum]GJE29691.1 hypothetical protein LKMONMHP_4575 [Methylobacterium organophilum]